MKTLPYAALLCSLLYALPFLPGTERPDSRSAYQKNIAPYSRSFFRIGDRLVTLERYGAQSSPFVLVSLHNDDALADRLAREAAGRGGAYLRLVNEGSRLVEATLLEKKISFDPAYIYTSWGRKLHLKERGCDDRDVDNCVQGFATFVLDDIGRTKTMVTINTGGGTTIAQYEEGGAGYKEVKQVYRNKDLSPASYFVTTDDVLFEQLSAAGRTTVLLHPRKAVDDGTLESYCIKARQRYVHLQLGSADDGKEWLNKMEAALR